MKIILVAVKLGAASWKTLANTHVYFAAFMQGRNCRGGGVRGATVKKYCFYSAYLYRGIKKWNDHNSSTMITFSWIECESCLHITEHHWTEQNWTELNWTELFSSQLSSVQSNPTQPNPISRPDPNGTEPNRLGPIWKELNSTQLNETQTPNKEQK